ncbi:hypothetical protein ILYODFUR_007724, partial [Ilyodon furcidens]
PSSARSLWETMLTSKHKEAVMEVRRHLVEAATKEKLPIKMSMGRVTPEQLCSYVKLFRSNWEALESHCGVLQLGLATAQMLRHPNLARWDSCLAFERLLLQCSCVAGRDATSQHDAATTMFDNVPGGRNVFALPECVRAAVGTPDQSWTLCRLVDTLSSSRPTLVWYLGAVSM